MNQITIDTYNQMALEYDLETKDFWSRFPRTFIDHFVELVRKGKVLDVGSGPGRDGVILKDAGLDITCLDASLAMIELSKEKGLHSILGDFNDLPFANNSFGGVWSYTSLLHVPKIEVSKSLSEIRRVLKVGGIFGLGLIEGEEELYRESSGMNKLRWFSFYKKEEVENLLKKNGFEILYFETFMPSKRNYLNFISKKVDN